MSMLPELLTTLLLLGCGIFVFIQYEIMARKQEVASEDLRKLRLDLHQDGWNPDRIGSNPLRVERAGIDYGLLAPFVTDWQEVKVVKDRIPDWKENETCCENEDRDMNGWCRSCGCPCY